MRDKLFLMASEEVIKELLQFEHNGVGKSQEVHDKYLTNLIKVIILFSATTILSAEKQPIK